MMRGFVNFYSVVLINVTDSFDFVAFGALILFHS